MRSATPPAADGLTWKKYQDNPVLTALPKNPWEKHKVTACQVEKRGDWYLMFYIGFEDEPTCADRPGSQQGRNHQLAAPSRQPDHLSWQGKWDHDACYKPFAIFDGKKWLLWYNGRHGALEQIGVVFHEGEDLGFEDLDRHGRISSTAIWPPCRPSITTGTC